MKILRYAFDIILCILGAIILVAACMFQSLLELSIIVMLALGVIAILMLAGMKTAACIIAILLTVLVTLKALALMDSHIRKMI